MSRATREPLQTISPLYLSVWDRIDEEMGDDGEIPFDLKLCLDAVQGEMTDRWEELAAVVAEYERMSDGCKAEMDRLAKRKKGIDKKCDRIRDYIKESMVTTGFKKHSGKRFTLSVNKNPPAVVIYNEDAIPDEYCETVMNLKISKTAIAEAIKKKVYEADLVGETINPDEIVPGAKMVAGNKLVIK